MTLNCEYIRDIAPEFRKGTLEATLHSHVREHLAACEECAEEMVLLDMIAVARPVVPAGLEDRIAKTASRRAPWYRSFRPQLAAAATVAIALFGGSVLIEPFIQRSSAPQTEIASPDATFGFMTVNDALMSGAASLDDLSEGQLEMLLEELQ